MRRWRSLDTGLLLALLLGLLLAWPFLARPGLPRATDAELHVYRTAELGDSLRAGVGYPRWAPDFYYGYGYPIFNYYAPFTYHLGNWLTLLHPERAVAGAKGVFLLAFVVGALGSYLLGKNFGGKAGGFLSALVFSSSPYLIFINPHLRGDLAEVFAVALLPLTLWCWERLWQGGGRWFLLGGVLTASVTLCSHNLTGLTLMGLLALLSLWQWLVLKRQEQFGWALLAGLLILTLTAFFWLPFLFERGYIKLDVIGGEHYDFRNHFVPLRTLLSLLPPPDWGATTPHAPMTAGLVGVIVAGCGAALSWIEGTQHKRLVFYALAAGLLGFLTTPYSAFLWESVPGLAYYQFPWRFLGPLAALLAPLAAGLSRWPRGMDPRWARAALLGAAIALLLAALPGLYPPPWPADFGDVSPLGMIDYELEGHARGTTSTDDFIPTMVDIIPAPAEWLMESYHHPPLTRIYGLPDGATSELLEQTPVRHRYRITSPEPFVLRFYLFYFPGWTAYIDGAQAPLDIAHPEGWMTVTLPAGTHEVLLRFEDTPPRRAGWLLALSGVGGLALAIVLYRKKQKLLRPQESVFPTSWIVLLLLGFTLFKVGIADRTPWFHYTSAPGEARPADYTQRADFGGKITLLGFDLSQPVARPGETLDVALYWTAERPVDENYQVFVHLVCPEGQAWAQSDHLNPGGFPTSRWPLDRYVWDEHQIRLPDTLPPGEYRLSVGLYTLQDQQRLPVLSADSGARSDNVILSQPVIVR